ncbi:MAG TPA: hypothetical protein VJ201_04600 [Candidatus Babeliales bacterium]|nr:hypothetical protein [Candidatus Babeliales bacterium]
MNNKYVLIALSLCSVSFAHGAKLQFDDRSYNIEWVDSRGLIGQFPNLTSPYLLDDLPTYKSIKLGKSNCSSLFLDEVTLSKMVDNATYAISCDGSKIKLSRLA